MQDQCPLCHLGCFRSKLMQTDQIIFEDRVFIDSIYLIYCRWNNYSFGGRYFANVVFFVLESGKELASKYYQII